MTRPFRWLVVMVVIGVLGSVAFVAFCWLTVSWLFNPARFDRDEVAYSAEEKIDGFDFKATLFRNHPMLAEYRKVVEVRQGERLILQREFIDPGGMAAFYFFRQDGRIIMVDGARNGFVLDSRSGETSNVDHESLPENLREDAFGRFMFLDQPTRIYKWVGKEDIPAD